MKLVIITGLSGAGKTQAIEALEDLGYYCIDNLPPALISNFTSLALGKGGIEKAALVMDIRGGTFFHELKQALEDLRKGSLDYKLLFLEASDEALLKRYNGTRRVHPLTGKPVTVKDITREREALSDIRTMADNVIDTSKMRPLRLSNLVKDIESKDWRERTFMLNIMSFGYKHGLPVIADTIYDVRFIPNPFYVSSLKNLTGNNKKVIQYVFNCDETKIFFETIVDLTDKLIPMYIKEGKFHLNVAFGCTGGQHRSVSLANEFEKYFREKGVKTTLDHRDAKK